MDERTKIDVNQDHTIAGVTYDASEDIMNLTLNPVDKRLRVDSAISDVGDGATSANQTSILTELQQKTEPTDIQLGELIILLRSLMIAIANPSYIDKSANAIRNQVQSGTITTVSTVTNMTNLNGNFGAFTADHLQRMNNMTAWASNIRNLIT